MNGDLINVSIFNYKIIIILLNRAMQIFFFLIFTLLLPGCASVKVVKEVTKATQSLKTSVTNIVNSVEQEKEILEEEKVKEKKLIIEQKKITKINFINEQLINIKLKLGEPDLLREDKDIQIVRFDRDKCRLFLFFNPEEKIRKVKYFEIRDDYGNLIVEKNKINKCYNQYE